MSGQAWKVRQPGIGRAVDWRAWNTAYACVPHGRGAAYILERRKPLPRQEKSELRMFRLMLLLKMLTGIPNGCATRKMRSEKPVRSKSR
jgi:hypothetical protein